MTKKDLATTTTTTPTPPPPMSSSLLPPQSKKRGRKPKGGKLVLKTNDQPTFSTNLPNIILHLKCSSNDLENYNENYNVSNPLIYNPSIPPEIKTYNDDFYSHTNQSFTENKEMFAYNTPTITLHPPPTCDQQECSTQTNGGGGEGEGNGGGENKEYNEELDPPISLKTINAKLKKLKIDLYKNNLDNKKSACFWCTCDFDNPECYIPKHEMDNTIFGYGSFCRPECAVAYLMKENINDSTKFERYHLLNQIYGKIYNHKKNIRPAPCPHYLLDKYYGNLTIQEYRKLLKTEHLLLIIDKPLTRVLPELHDDNEDVFFNICGGSGGTTTTTQHQMGMYKVKKQSEKQNGPSKSSIIRNQFGL